MVIQSHLRNPWLPLEIHPEILRRLWSFILRDAYYFMTLFFVISGFLITRIIDLKYNGIENPDLRGFYVGRAARILPLLLVISIVGVFIIALPGIEEGRRSCFLNPNIHPGFKFWLSIASFSFNWFRIANEQITPFFGLNWDVLWSLAVEEQFYISYPIILWWLAKERKIVRCLVGVIILSLLFRFYVYKFHPLSVWGRLYSTFSCMDSLAVGSLLYILGERTGAVLRIAEGRRVWILATGAGLLGILYILTNPGGNARDGVWGPTAFALGSALMILGERSLKMSYPKFLRQISRMGQWVYGGYLWQASIFFCLWPILPKLNFPERQILVFTAVMVAAWLSFKFIEVPANRVIKKLFNRSHPVQVAEIEQSKELRAS
jgi:peptidoglycan/LPS O-acetylase OafA/YrhL